MHQRKHGFTIIEVSLVLAIAGLILVMAFIALPALQRQSRDAERKEDTALFVQALKKYQQNNRGQLPEANIDNYYGDSHYSIITESHSGEEYNLPSWQEIDQIQDNPWANFYIKYLGENFLNPDGEKYTFLIQSLDGWHNHTDIDNETFKERIADLYIFISATCKNGEPIKSNNARNIAIITKLEAGTYCTDM